MAGSDSETLLEKLISCGGLCKLERRIDEARALSRQGKIYVTEIDGRFYAALSPRSELARLQEKLARHKITWLAGSQSDPARADDFARAEADIAREFRAIGHPPSYPSGF